MKVLHAKTGPLQGNTYPIQGRTLLGRDGDCDVQVIDRGVSRKHACVLEQDDGSVLLRDLASHNGTYVCHTRVTEALLSSGDEIAIGDSSFEYRIVEGDLADTQELDIKLISGPAKAPTLTTPLTREDRAEIMARVEAARAEAAAARGEACCDSPLAAQARAQGWKFCPECGSAISH